MTPRNGRTTHLVCTAGDLPGFKRRVKVRTGYHTADVGALSDDDLPWAYCMMPVTAGGNQGGMSQSVNFSGGEWVFGFFLDGEDGQQPVVMGVLDKSSRAYIPKRFQQLDLNHSVDTLMVLWNLSIILRWMEHHLKLMQHNHLFRREVMVSKQN